MAGVPSDESSDELSESESSVVQVTLDELEDGEIIDVDEEEVPPPTPGTIKLDLVCTHDLTDVMAGTRSCSTDSGKSNSNSNNDSRDTRAFDRLARDIGNAINDLDRDKTNKT